MKSMSTEAQLAHRFAVELWHALHNHRGQPRGDADVVFQVKNLRDYYMKAAQETKERPA